MSHALSRAPLAALSLLVLNLAACGVLGGEEPQDCGDPQAFVTCDPLRPNDVYFADECGNPTSVAIDCMDSTSECVVTQDTVECACETLPETYCRLPDVAINYYDTSYVVQRDTCGNEIVVEECGFGSFCDKDARYNDGQASCQRSLSEEQSDSPYYDYGCHNFPEYTYFKTKLKADCRCRGTAGQGTDFVEASTQTFPYGKLPNCMNTIRLRGQTFDPPLGSGPQFNAWGIEGDEDWFGGWLDPQEREFYAVTSWTSPKYRAAGAIVSYKLDTGARRVISGIYPDARMGEVEFGSGYVSANTLEGGPPTRPLAAVSSLRAGPDRMLYTLGVGNTGQAESNSAEIVRVDPQSGERTLVWQSRTTERGDTTSAFGQCLSNNTPDESVWISPRAFAIEDSGDFLLSFYRREEGSGLIRVSADGSECTFISRFNADDLNVGTGYDPQVGAKLRGMLVRNGSIYTTISPWGEFLRIDLETGDRVAVSNDNNPGPGPGEDNIIFDESRQLFYTSGGPGRYEGAIIDESTGARQGWYRDNESVGLVETVYGVRRDISSFQENPLHNGNYLGPGPFALDPDDPDIVWLIVKGGGLIQMEWSTLNGIITSY